MNIMTLSSKYVILLQHLSYISNGWFMILFNLNFDKLHLHEALLHYIQLLTVACC